MGEEAEEELNRAIATDRPERPRCCNCGIPLISQEDGICEECASGDLDD